MHLKEFSLVSPVIQGGEVLKAIVAAIPPEAIERAIAQTGTRESLSLALPAHLVVSLVIAISLWSTDSMRAVLKNLVDGLSQVWVKVGKYWKVPMFVSNYSSQATTRTTSDKSVILPDSASDGNKGDARSLPEWNADSGN